MAENSKVLVLEPPFDDTLFVADFFWLTTVCIFRRPNCTSVRRPNRLETPGMRLLFEGMEMLPASTNLMISSSLPSYFSFRLCESKSNEASVL